MRQDIALPYLYQIHAKLLLTENLAKKNIFNSFETDTASHMN